MRPTLPLCVSACLIAGSAFAGAIRGSVRAQPNPAAETENRTDNYESRKYKFAEKVDYASLRDFVVYVDQPVTPPPPPPTKLAQVLQEGVDFKPHVLPILVGTSVEWPNKDDIFHNVFSDSDANRFDLGLFKHPSKTVPFLKPGRVDVFCSIHSKMHCIILVLENPYFAATDAKNNYEILNIPAGKYRLKAWHERVPAQIREVVVPETGEIRVDFTLGVQDLPKI